MRTLRFILAIAVVMAHMSFDAAVHIGGGGAAIMAVKLFFLLSGFYMALVLDEKYRGHALAFYKARLLRLIPLYWVTIIATLIFFFGTSFGSWSGETFLRAARLDISWLEVLVAAVSNLTFLGLDLGGLLCEQSLPGCTPLVGLALVPQAWTLGIELIFYLIAPVIAVIGWRAVVMVLVAAIGIKGTIIFMGLGATPWGRQFALAEMVYFMLGMLSFAIYKSLRHRLPNPRYFLPLIPIVAVMIFGYAQVFSQLYYTKHQTIDLILDPLFFFSMTLMVPFLFHSTAGRRWDELIGDFSYPIYITHIFTLNGSMMLADRLAIADSWHRFGFHLVLILTVAFLGMAAVVWPIEIRRGRQRRLASGSMNCS